jgi:hypothetical protein
LVYFHILAFVSNAAMNTDIKILVESLLSTWGGGGGDGVLYAQKWKWLD